MEFLNHAVVLAALAVVAIQQILKLKIVPSQIANKYPVPTLIVLSIVAGLITVWKDNVPQLHVWTDWVQLIATIAIIAAITYNATLRNWKELREIEGEG